MRTRAILTGAFAALGIGFVGVVAVASPPAPSTSVPTSADPVAASATSDDTATTPTPGATTSAGTAASASLKDGTFTGSTQSERFGQVQVRITVAGGKITDVATPILVGNEGRSTQINNRAAPMLRTEVLASQSAQVSTVGGATYTSDAYLTSLQSAIDQAKA